MPIVVPPDFTTIKVFRRLGFNAQGPMFSIPNFVFNPNSLFQFYFGVFSSNVADDIEFTITYGGELLGTADFLAAEGTSEFYSFEGFIARNPINQGGGAGQAWWTANRTEAPVQIATADSVAIASPSTLAFNVAAGDTDGEISGWIASIRA